MKRTDSNKQEYK